jgi:dihydrofolate reductase
MNLRGTSADPLIKSRQLTLIVAMTPGGVIGKDGKIPWHVPQDLKRFKKLTTGHTIIMGRKTYDSIGKPLPDRHSVVVTNNVNKEDIGDHGKPVLTHAHSIDDALGIAYEYDSNPFVIGGAAIYRLALPFVTRLEITWIVQDSVAGDTFCPRFGGDGSLYPDLWRWRCTNVETHLLAEGVDIEFHTFERRSGQPDRVLGRYPRL